MSSEAFKPILSHVASGATLDPTQARTAFQIILRGEASEAQIASFVSLLHLRGETADEIASAATVLRDNALRVTAPSDAIDMVGTGGDGVGTLNISTAAALVVAACGVKVAKHGNRAQSSKSGSADVLSALGVRLSLPPSQIQECIAKAGIGFMFAPDHHSALAHVGPVRRQLGFRTIFNLLGPLCNPAFVTRQLVGVFAAQWLKPYAEVLHRLGSTHAWIVHSEDSLDELSIAGASHVVELANGRITEFSVTPEDAGLPRHPIGSILGGDAAHNAAAISRLLNGERGPYHDIVCLNAAAALKVAGVARDLRAGAQMAAQAIATGSAKQVLKNLVEATLPPNVLETIAAYKREEIKTAKQTAPIHEVEQRARAADPVRGFKKALEQTISSGRPALIAEIKKASPSKGLIRPDFDPKFLAKAYANGGATCLSVLTDAPSFQGSNQYLVDARAAVNLPVLRKDFLYDPYQVAEARALGADCILIIMASVSDQQARELNANARHWKMDVLVEVHDQKELERALQLAPDMIGINNRDLRTFKTALETTETLAPQVPQGVLVVSESGISNFSDIARLMKSRVNAFLVGESLMRETDVVAATKKLLGTANA